MMAVHPNPKDKDEKVPKGYHELESTPIKTPEGGNNDVTSPSKKKSKT